MSIKFSTKRRAHTNFVLTFALSLSLFAAACSKDSNSNNSNTTGSSNANTSSPTKAGGATPTEALKAYYDAARKKDVETAKKYLSKGTMQKMEEIAKAQGKTLDQMLQEGADRDVQVPMPEFSNERVNGDTATVDIKAPNQPLVPMQMVKEDGVWKLAIDKMMQGMGKPQGEEHGDHD
jgi:flagellar hook-associated protein FlgK